MQKEIVLKLKPAEALDDSVIKTYISNASAVPFSGIGQKCRKMNCLTWSINKRFIDIGPYVQVNPNL
jgi:hypothetical protein